MKVRIEAECTPEEARAFLGLPDVTPLNAKIVDEMMRRVETNAAMLQPDELMRSWATWGGQAQEQFRSLMQTAVRTAGSPPRPKDEPGA
jgi:hypothetical protein